MDVTPTSPAYPDARWRDLYRVGGYTAIALVVITTVAIVAYFIWPYAPGLVTTEELYQTLQTNLIGGLASLDVLLVVGLLAQIPLLLALYAALKPLNESYALLALVVGLMAIAANLPSRPIMELVILSDLHAAATTEAARAAYITAGETLLTHFDGTTWAVSTILLSVAGLLFSLLMLRSPVFRRGTAIVGIVTNASQLGFVLPGLAAIMLLIATFGGIVWLVLIAQDLLRIDRQPQPRREVQPTAG